MGLEKIKGKWSTCDNFKEKFTSLLIPSHHLSPVCRNGIFAWKRYRCYRLETKQSVKRLFLSFRLVVSVEINSGPLARKPARHSMQPWRLYEKMAIELVIKLWCYQTLTVTAIQSMKSSILDTRLSTWWFPNGYPKETCCSVSKSDSISTNNFNKNSRNIDCPDINISSRNIVRRNPQFNKLSKW